MLEHYQLNQSPVQKGIETLYDGQRYGRLLLNQSPVQKGIETCLCMQGSLPGLNQSPVQKGIETPGAPQPPRALG